MNNQSPLIPPGSLLEQKNKGRARVKIAVFLVLAVHGVGLLALLMQGCRQAQEPAPPETAQTNAPPAVEQTNAPPAVETAPPVAPPVQPPAVEAAVPAAEYAIASGDNFTTIAKKFHVSVKAIIDANPGVEPTKLKVGQKIHIPAAPPAPAAASGLATPVTQAAGSGEQTYSVESGDTLTKIASKFGTTVPALRTANDLKTDRIKVGQKLKIPGKHTAPAAPPSAMPAEVPPAAPATAPPSPAAPGTAPPGR